MQKSRWHPFIIASMIILLLIFCAGCEKNPPAPQDTIPTAPSTVPETEPSAYDLMLDRSLAHQGNNQRLMKVIEKIRAGEEVTVGFIGGSITEGYNAAAGKNYATLVAKYLDETYSDGTGKVTCVNAGLSGTPSTLGLVRAERDLLYAKPDLIFIEFAVNDAQSFTDKQAFESLIRKCLLQDNTPAVILLYSVTENGYSCQDNMALSAFYYDLPAVSVRDAILPEIESGNMTWDDWSDDEVHPHAQGHELYSRFIAHCIETLISRSTEAEYQVPSKPQFSRNWSEMAFFDSSTLSVTELGDFERTAAHPHFQGSYSYLAREDSSNQGISFDVTGSALFIVYKTTTAATYGTVEVLVDGEVVAHLSGCTPDGWNNPVAQLIFSNKESSTHHITIRMQPGDEGKRFDLLGIGVVDE